MKLNGKSRRSTNLFRRSSYQKLIFSGMKIFYHDSAVNNRRIKLKAKTVVKNSARSWYRFFHDCIFFSWFLHKTQKKFSLKRLILTCKNFLILILCLTFFLIFNMTTLIFGPYVFSICSHHKRHLARQFQHQAPDAQRHK